MYRSGAVKPQGNETPLSDACLQKEVKKLKEADKDGNQTIIVSDLFHFSCRNLHNTTEIAETCALMDAVIERTFILILDFFHSTCTFVYF